MTATTEPHYLTVAELANRLGVCKNTIRAHAEELGGLRVGRQWRFDADLITAPTLRTGRGSYDHPDSERLR